MTQLAALYTHDLRNSGMAWDGPVFFMNPLVSAFVTLLGLGGFVAELVVGFGSKPWWEALLLPIPPFMFASVWYKRHNPVFPSFTGAFALVLALLLKVFA